MSFFSELKRRNVFRVAAAYLVAGWLLIEVSATLEETLRLPEWADTLLAFFLILGFPIALFFSWAYEITPDGIKREKDVETTDEIRAHTANRLNWIVIILLVLAVSLFVVDRFVLEESTPEQAVSETTQVAEDPPVTEDGATTSPELSIAVLPFVNMSSDEEQEYFSDGLTEELLNLLAGVEQLKVAARTSTFYYKDKVNTISLAEIARELDVAHILEGSVRKGGNRIRITAQLIKADDGFHLWSNTWDRTLEDIFAIQDEIAAAVTEELKITLLGDAPTAKVIDTESYELTLQARFLFNRRLPGDLEKALELFERAIELDPDNVAAWVGVSPLYLWLFDPPRIEDALIATERAIALDPTNPEAWSRRSSALYSSGDKAGADQAWEKAVELGKDNLLIQAQVAGQLGDQGDLDGVIEVMRRVSALDPLNQVNLGNLVFWLMMADRFDEAEEIAEKMLRLTPNSPMAARFLGEIHLLKGNPGKAREQVEKLDFSYSALQYGTETPEWWSAMLEHSSGNTTAARESLDRFIAEYGEKMPIEVANVYAWRGENDLAFEWLERALQQVPDLSVEYSWSPWLNSLEDDPRWAELMKRWTGTSSWEDF